MKWFVLENEEILGPFKKSYVEENFSQDSLVWGESLSEWMPKKNWLAFVASSEYQQNRVHALKEATATQLKLADEPSENFEWYYAYKGTRNGPYDELSLITTLSTMHFTEQVYLWHKGFTEWKKLEEFSAIYELILASQNQAA